MKYRHDPEPLPINDQHRSRGHPYWPLYPHEWIFEWTSSCSELFLLLHDMSQTPEVRFIASPWTNNLSTMQVTVTPKILLGLFKNFIWLEGGDLNFSFKRTLPFKIFLWQEFYLVSPKTWFWSWRFLLFILDSSQNAFHLGKMSFENFFENTL